MGKQTGGKKSRTIGRPMPADADAASRKRTLQPAPQEESRSPEEVAIADFQDSGNSPWRRGEGLRFLGEDAAPSDEVRDALFGALRDGLFSKDRYENALGRAAFEAILKYLERDPGLKAEFAAPLARLEGTPEDAWAPYVHRKNDFADAVHSYCVTPAKEEGTPFEELREIYRKLTYLEYVPEPGFQRVIAEGIDAVKKRLKELGVTGFGDLAEEVEEADSPPVVKRENVERTAQGQQPPPDLSQATIARGTEASPVSRTAASKRKRLAHVDQVMTLRQELAAFNEKVSETLEPLVASFGELLRKHDFAGCDDLKANQATIEALNYVAGRLEVGFVCPREANPKDGGDAEEIPSVLRCSTAPGAPEGVVSFEHPRADGGGRNAHGGFTAWARLALIKARKSLLG